MEVTYNLSMRSDYISFVNLKRRVNKMGEEAEVCRLLNAKDVES